MNMFVGAATRGYFASMLQNAPMPSASTLFSFFSKAKPQNGGLSSM